MSITLRLVESFLLRDQALESQEMTGIWPGELEEQGSCFPACGTGGIAHSAVLPHGHRMLAYLSTLSLALARAINPLVSQALNSLTNFIYI